MNEKLLDLAHPQRISAILDAIPGDGDLPHALLAIEDAYVICQAALDCHVSLVKARVMQRQIVTKEETRRLLLELRKRNVKAEPETS